MGESGISGKGHPLSASRDPDSEGGDFHFQHGFYEMWVTKALNGDREQAQLFLAFGRGLAQAGIPARSPIARRMRGREAGGGRVGVAYTVFPAACQRLSKA